MDQPEQPDQPDASGPQSGWTVDFDAEDGESETPPSGFVEVTITHRLRVLDEAALRSAVEAFDGPPGDESDRRLRKGPANLIGLLLSGPHALPDMPGVERQGSAMSIGEYEPDRM